MYRKIAIFARDPIGTGGGRVAIETAKYFASCGDAVVFVSDVRFKEPLDAINHLSMPFGDLVHTWQPRLMILRRLRHLIQLLAFSVYGCYKIRRLEADGYITIDHNIEAASGQIIVLHNVFLEQARADNRPLAQKLAQYLNPIFGFRIWREARALKSARTRHVVAVAPQLLEEAKPYLRRNVETAFIPNGVDLVRFAPPEEAERLKARASLGLQSEFALLFVGHEFDRKRLDLVIKALALVSASVKLLVIGGRGSSVERFEQKARDAGVISHVSFLGTRDDIEHIMAAADGFCLPSDYEAWPLVVFEAMASGLPCILTPVGSAPYVIRHGENGFIVDSNAESIAAKIRQLARDRSLCKSLGAAARRDAQQYSWQSISERYSQVVDAVSQDIAG